MRLADFLSFSYRENLHFAKLNKKTLNGLSISAKVETFNKV